MSTINRISISIPKATHDRLLRHRRKNPGRAFNLSVIVTIALEAAITNNGIPTTEEWILSLTKEIDALKKTISTIHFLTKE